MKYKAQVNLDNLNSRVVADQYKKELDVKLRSLLNISNNKRKDTTQAINDTALTILERNQNIAFM